MPLDSYMRQIAIDGFHYRSFPKDDYLQWMVWIFNVIKSGPSFEFKLNDKIWNCRQFCSEAMSRKAAPKPEELIQKLEEKFDGFKV